MKNIRLAFIAIGLFTVMGCEIEAEQINYGSDVCNFCKMTIVDQQHASQYVTSKGKQFKFDAIECMLNEFSEKSTNNAELILVADYNSPGSMVYAQSSTYIICQEIKSPMGAFLSALPDENSAKELLQEKGGKIYSWTTIKEKYSVK